MRVCEALPRLPLMKRTSSYRPESLENAPLHYAPENELGVVYLFSHLASKYRIKLESIHAAFPDCIAFQRVGGREKKIRIEFEFKSSNFVCHKHNGKNCDMIVCWKHDWSTVPKGCEHIQVIELRREFGLGFNVWIMPVRGSDYCADLSKDAKKGSTEWTVSPTSHRGDLILFYETKPSGCIQHVFKLEDDPEKQLTGDWSGFHIGPLKKVSSLQSPIFFEDLKRDKFIRTAGFVRNNLIGSKIRATEYWPYLHDLIIRRNPSQMNPLKKFAAAFY